MNVTPIVFAVGDDRSGLIGLRELVESSDLAFRTFESAEAFLNQYDPNRPGCVIVYVRTVAKGGVGLQRRLSTLGYSIPVIIISADSDMAMAVRAMKAGAVTVLKSPVNRKLMMDSIREAIAKDSSTRQANAHAVEVRKRLALLTPREREVLELLVHGKANKEVAVRLALSEKTVEIHRAHVMKKLQAPNLAALMRLVLFAGAYNEAP
jgi:FixJ family two-component response regulator